MELTQAERHRLARRQRLIRDDQKRRDRTAEKAAEYTETLAEMSDEELAEEIERTKPEPGTDDTEEDEG